MPKISEDAQQIGHFKKISRKTTTIGELKKFLKSQDFQDFCNLKQNKIVEGTLIWIVKAENSCSELQGVKGTIHSEFEILTGCDGLGYVKYPKFISKIGVGMKKILFSQSYIVRKKDNKEWKADIILADEAWLKMSNVSAAFSEIALYQGLKLVGKPTMMGLTSKSDAVAGEEEKKIVSPTPHGWIQVVTNKQGQGRLLVCLVDSGKIFECAPDEYSLAPASCPGMVKTQYNWFKYFLREALVRN